MQDVLVYENHGFQKILNTLLKLHFLYLNGKDISILYHINSWGNR